ncbi:MAG: prolipoprotein diacylglyceryl transferase [Oscillatoriales cyanobacterium]|nr:MAG: prolipoprotein diacylglyceryl transferase [Oscillatoriales cyanobacterium]
MVLNILALPLGFQFTSPGPIIFQLGPLAVRWYGLLIASAVLIGVSLSQYLAEKRRVNPELLGDLAIWLVLGAIPCARIYYVAFEWPQYAQRPEDIIAIWKGGIAIHGAILGGTIAALIFGKIQRVSFWQLADLIAPSAILGQAIGRWGNFFNSEAFGSPTDLPWKLYIPANSRPQAYAVFGLLLTLFFRDLQGKIRLKTGALFLIYIAAYSSGRVWIEGLRTDSLMFGPLRTAQMVSLTGIVLGLGGLAWLYLLDRPLPDVISATQRR